MREQEKKNFCKVLKLSLGVVPSCLVPGPHWSGGGIVALSVSLKEERVGCRLWIGWFASERCAYSESFSIFRNTPPWEAVPSVAARPNCQSTGIQKICLNHRPFLLLTMSAVGPGSQPRVPRWGRVVSATPEATAQRVRKTFSVFHHLWA